MYVNNEHWAYILNVDGSSLPGKKEEENLIYFSQHIMAKVREKKATENEWIFHTFSIGVTTRKKEWKRRVYLPTHYYTKEYNKRVGYIQMSNIIFVRHFTVSLFHCNSIFSCILARTQRIWHSKWRDGKHLKSSYVSIFKCTGRRMSGEIYSFERCSTIVCMNTRD